MRKTAIIIITHNRADKLNRLLKSIDKYTQNYNLYVLDNGTDNYQDINKLKQIKNSYSFSFFERSDKNLFPGQARNALFDNVGNEELLVTLDDDMIVSNGWLDGLQWIIQQGYDGAGSRIIQESKNVIHSQGGFWTRDGSYLTFKEHLRGKSITYNAPFLKCDWLPSGCSLYKSYIVKEFKYDSDLPNMEDPIHCYTLKQNGFKLASTDKCIVIHSHGTTANPQMRSKENLAKSIALIHHKYGFNVIKSWNMNNILLKHTERKYSDIWIYNQKVRFGIIKEEQKKYPVRNDVPITHKKTLNDKNKFLSIIIPFRSRTKFIKSVLHSISIQQNISLDAIEVIVVNLGGKSLNGIISGKEIYVDYNKVFNKAYACNIGAKSANGKYILFTDADIMFPLHFISELISLANKHRVLKISTVDLNPEITQELMQLNVVNMERYNPALLNPKFSNKMLLVRKSEFIEKGGFDESYFGAGCEINEYVHRNYNQYEIDKIADELISRNIIGFHLFHPNSVNTKEILAYNKNVFMLNINNRFINKPWGKVSYPPIFKTSKRYPNEY